MMKIDTLKAMRSEERCKLRSQFGSKKVPRFDTKRGPLLDKAARRGVPGAFGSSK